MGRLGRGDDLLFRGRRAPERDVLTDRALEEPRVLQDHSDVLAQVVAAHARRVATVEHDRAVVDVVEPHHQVHEGRLARAGRTDDRHGGAGFGHEGEVFDERAGRVVGERDALELDPAPRIGVDQRIRPGRSLCSSTSSSSNTRSREAMPDWSVFTMAAICVSGCVNWREYWMNAWMSPTFIVPVDTLMPPMTAMARKFRLPRNMVAGCTQPEMNWAEKLDVVELVVLLVELLLLDPLLPENLHQVVAGERFLDLRVEQARVLPLLDEARTGALGDQLHEEHRDGDDDHGDPSQQR